MRVPWTHRQCIVCNGSDNLSDEHIIPDCLGGRLVCRFLCKSCNDALGSEVEAVAKRDPAIALALHHFCAAHPERGQALVEGMHIVAHSGAGKVKAQIRNGDVRVASRKLCDGSLIQPTDTARETVRRILEKGGTSPVPLEEALRRFDAACADERTEIAPTIDIVDWNISKIEPDLSGPRLNPLVPIKIAFEFLACHLGSAIYEEGPPFDAVRQSLHSGQLHDSLEVESLQAKRSNYVHGIVFEGNQPHAKVQVRLFGKLAYRVHFRNLAVSGSRFVYTHALTTNEEAVAYALDTT